jgi:hypothetical protein
LSIVDVMTGANLNGSQVTAQLASGGIVTCTFVGASCASTAGVVVVNADTISASTVWTINNQTGQSLASLTIQLAAAAFNPCVSGNQPLNSFSTCTSGTPGAGDARSVSGNLPNTGTTFSAATVAYTNRVLISGQGSPTNDLFKQIQLLFGSNGSPFRDGETFTFMADTDLLQNPEPATYGLVGSAFLALALVRRRRNK